MSEKKEITDFSIEELKVLAQEAGLEAREESLNAGIEIMSENDDGTLTYEKKDDNGSIVSRKVPNEDLVK